MENTPKVPTTIQSNTLTLSRSNFTVPQRRILFAIVETLSPYLRSDLDFKKGKEISYQTALDDLGKIIYKACDLSTADNYGELRTALLQLEDKKYFIETEDFELRTRLILQSKFKKRSEYIEIVINTDLFDVLLDLKKGYTLYQTKVALSFTSIYAMKLYELIAKWRNAPKFYIDIDELRRMTDTHGKYMQVADFKKNVLDVARAQLNASDVTDLRFKYTEKKFGKRITGFDITLIKTENSHDHIEVTTPPPSLRWDFRKDLIDNFAHYGIVAKGETAKTIKAYQAKFGEHRLAQDLENFAKLAEKNNARIVPAYIMSCFKKGLNAPIKTSGVATPGSYEKYEKEAWEMTKEERVAHAMKVRAENDNNNSMKPIADLFPHLVK
jgi:plasmid replication initiation protein